MNSTPEDLKLTSEQYEFLRDWVERNFIPSKNINRRVCAYTFHGIFERLYDKGFYVTEFDVAKALIECGYEMIEQDGQMYFNVSEQSRAIQIYRSSLGDQTKAHRPEWL